LMQSMFDDAAPEGLRRGAAWLSETLS
jgi:hypothetical protein